MNKVLKRSMFSMPKHEHKSTGIASGLEYRPGYRVGGRVGYKDGTDPWVKGQDPKTRKQKEFTDFTNTSGGLTTGGLPNLDVNPDLFLSSDKIKEITEKILPITRKDLSSYAIDYSDPSLQVDYSKYQPSRLGAVGSAAAATIGEQIPVGQSQLAKFVSNLSNTSADYAARRQELDQLEEQQRISTEIKTREDKQALSLAEEEDVRAQEDRQLDFAQDLTMAGMEAKLALQISAMEEPAKIAEIKFLMSADGGSLSGQEARSKVYGTEDDQTRLFQSFVELYSQPDEFGDAPDPQVALQDALKAIRLWLGGDIDPGLQERIDEFLKSAATANPQAVTGRETAGQINVITDDPDLNKIISGN
jgi:hypothetical protein